MERIKINGSTSYEYIIDNELMSASGLILHDYVGGNKTLIICDEITANLFLDTVSQSLNKAGYKTFSFIAKSSENENLTENQTLTSSAINTFDSIKSLDNFGSILNFLSKNNFEKSDLLIALGGGAIGDLAGFAAATYKRGLNFAILPTTLLSAVDSSVGGKNALNLPNAKNQIGVIRNPSIVLCDPLAFSTLSQDAFLDGYAEIVKYGILEGFEIIESLKSAILANDFHNIICKSVNIKKKYVEKDERDNNMRQFLNLGHLIGHAIEAQSNYTISHGSAIAKGLFYESKITSAAGFSQYDTHLEIAKVLIYLGFDLSLNCNPKELIQYIEYDKRIKNNKTNLIIPQDFGNCIMKSITKEELIRIVR